MPGVDISQFTLVPAATIAEAITTIDRSGRVSLALVVDGNQRLLNTISDGDVRRGLLAGLRLSDRADLLLAIKAKMPHPAPVTAPVGTSPGRLAELMRSQSVRQIPLLDAAGRVVDVVLLTDLLPAQPSAFSAVVMAGGLGSRLRPLTENLPKPMLPVGGRPLMERILEQLRETGISNVSITTNYQAEKIVEHFGNGQAFGVDIQYVNEDVPLGTGGALGLMARPTETLLVINGDILTHVDFRKMFAYHQEQNAEMTVAVRRYEFQVPYGVVQCEGPSVVQLQEKPLVELFVNAGIYLLEPSVLDDVQPGRHLNITDLIQTLIERGRTVASFPICEYWLDIGQRADYEQAQSDAADGKLDRTPRVEVS